MKLKHILTFLVVLTLIVPAVSAGFWGDLFGLITGRAVAQDGIYVEYDAALDLTETLTCNNKVAAYAIKSYGNEVIELPDYDVLTKEVYITKGGCKGMYYKDSETGLPVSLRVIAADMIIKNRYYRISIDSGIDLTSVFGQGYSNIQMFVLSSDESTMKLESGVSKTDTIYLYEAGTKKKIIYPDSSGTLYEASSLKEKMTFDGADALVPKKLAAEEPAKTAEEAKMPEGAWDERRVSDLEAQVGSIAMKVDQLSDKVDNLAGTSDEEEGFWSSLFN